MLSGNWCLTECTNEFTNVFLLYLTSYLHGAIIYSTHSTSCANVEEVGLA